MTSSIPFSIEPDAEDYLQSHFHGMSPRMVPVIKATTSQSDGLKPPRWSYEGESFVVDRFKSNGSDHKEFPQFHLFGRAVAIEPDALKHLTGRVLRLRRVDARIGLINIPGYVLVAGSADDPPVKDFGSERLGERIKKYISVSGLTILGGFTGMGVAWIIYGIISAVLRIPMEKLFESKLVWPIFATGWILGAIVSFFFFASVFKSGGRSGCSQTQRQRKYRVRRDVRANLDWWIFIGVPASLMAVAILIIKRFAHTDGQEAYGAVAALMIVFGGTLYFCDRMPRRLVFWLGLCGWLLALVVGCWHFRTYGP